MRFMLAGEPRRWQRGVPSGGALKMTAISFFFENLSNGLQEAAGSPKCPQELPKKPKRVPEGSLLELSGTTFDSKTAILEPR